MCVIIIQSKLLTISSEPRKLVYQKKNSESLFLISLLFLSLWYRIFFDPPVRIFISFGAVSPFPPKIRYQLFRFFFFKEGWLAAFEINTAYRNILLQTIHNKPVYDIDFKVGFRPDMK